MDGACVDENGGDQDVGEIEYKKKRVEQPECRKWCLALINPNPGYLATACEYDTSTQVCLIHTQPIIAGSVVPKRGKKCLTKGLFLLQNFKK